jgi:hypothetical protein
MKDLVTTSVGRLVLIALTAAGLMFPAIAVAQVATPKGALTNGQNHTGAIASGETHAWTIAAAAGDAIVLSVAEVGADSAFTPWIGLFAPNGTNVTSNYGTLTAHINVNATMAGTYIVYIASATTSQNTAAGNYMLTLAHVPEATFVIPAGDEGGPMTNGANHPGYITRGDQDQWTFAAAAGNSVSVSIGEVGADTQFAPWVRIFAPNGAYLGEGYSQLGGRVSFEAPSSGTYTVVVASSDATYSAPGNYLVTMAKTPGAFVVPDWDEGGPMTNGVVYPGTIHRADMDQWAFLAAAGSTLTVNAAEVGGDSGFYPWLRLYGPTGTFLGQSYAPTAAQVSVQVPTTGLYTVVIASADLTYTASGNYTITANGINPPPALALGDIVADFGASGLWIQTNHSGPNSQWQQLGSSATRLARGDIDGTGTVSLVASFQGAGVWIWRSASGWTQLHALDASDILTADLDGNGQDDIILSFPGAGTWVLYNNTTWSQLHPLTSSGLSAGNIDGDSGRKADLIVNFAGYGVWAYVNNASWYQLNAAEGYDIHTGDFDGDGQDNVVMNIAGQGIWTWSVSGGWSQLHSLNSTAIAVGNIDGDLQRKKDIIVSFAAYGVFVWLNNGGWTQLHALNAPVMGTVDIDKDGKDDIVMSFPGNGTWIWKNNTSWEAFHPADVKAVAAGRYDIN